MGILMIREPSVEPVDAKDFTEWVRALRERYSKAYESHNFKSVGGQRFKSVTRDRIKGIEFHIFWYDDGTSRGRCIRIADIPGTLSGEILRLRESIPQLYDEDHEIIGNQVRQLVGEDEPRARIVNPPYQPEDPTDMVKPLPLIEVDPNKHATKQAKHRSEIVNHLRCQGGSCPGTPISPHITRLLGKSPEDHLVFERLVPGEIFGVFDSLLRYKLWILQLISGLKALHSLGIIHRNLSLEKLYYRYRENNESELVIGGISGEGGNDFAPEIPSQLALDGAFNEKTDIYDIGEVVESLVYGGLPITNAVDRGVPYPLQVIVEACQQTVPELRPGLNSLQTMVEKIQEITPVNDEWIYTE